MLADRAEVRRKLDAILEGKSPEEPDGEELNPDTWGMSPEAVAAQEVYVKGVR